MPALYHELLDATIDHLQHLKAGGVRFLDVSPDTLAALKNNPARDIAPPAFRPSAPLANRVPPAAVPTSVPGMGAAEPRPPEPCAASPSPSPSPLPPGTSPPLTLPAEALDPAARVVAMTDLRERALVCAKCPNLASSRKNVVFGVGDINAPLMFVGEAPGADEDAQGEPFVGAAGQLLTRIIQTMGFARQTVYIANILKCRPDTPGQTSGNRKPTADELKTCIPYLHSQIDLIRPKALVALGATAVEGLLGKTEGISRIRGRWQEYRGIPLMPTFHPSYLLRNQALGEKRKVWEDMLRVMEYLQMPISGKHRGYFLRA